MQKIGKRLIAKRFESNEIGMQVEARSNKGVKVILT